MTSTREESVLRSNAKPLLSIVVVFFNMQREAPRTLYTLSREYQRGVAELDYEVIAIDNGSDEPIAPEVVSSFGPEFRYIRLGATSGSPCSAINIGAAEAVGSNIAVAIDGARMVSPGMLRYMAIATRLAERPVITSLGWHLGQQLQNISMLDGYNQASEDELLDGIAWQSDGYELFTVASIAASSSGGWSRPLPESNLMTVSAATFAELDGYEERFRAPGGGLANLDFLKRALELPGSQHFMILGEGTFHQFHGGVATNVPLAGHPFAAFHLEYEQIRGEPFQAAAELPVVLGSMPRSFLGPAAALIAQESKCIDAGRQD